jgi:2-polyprenyl-6-methoxyphenol hydroxylase-like FAD-dependent oxidoreductase
VLIVGGGPVGLSLALDLGQRGVDTLLIERNTREGEQPRMDMVGVRTMEFARRWGIVEEIEAAGFPRDIPQDIAWSFSILGRQFIRDAKPSMIAEPLPLFSPQKRERCPQNFFDPVLRRAAEREGSVQLLFGAEVTSVQQDAGYVEADFVADGGTTRVQSDYLVGCDGAGGITRRSAGISLTGPAALSYSLNVVFSCPAIREMLSDPPAYRYVLIGAEGLWATIVNIDGRNNWRLQALGDEKPVQWSDDLIRSLIARAIGADLPYELISVAPWTRREVVAASFRKGRCFLAGDSAHQMSPTGGYGMNSGIADAVNLSWKLDAALKGWAGPNLLDSYDLERRPVTAWTATIASGNLKRMRETPKSPSTDPEHPSLNFAAVSAHAVMQEEYRSIGVHMGYSYDTSPIVCQEGPPREIPIGSLAPTAIPGSRAPHAWIEPGVSTLDRFGDGMTLLDFSDDAARSSSLVEAAAARGVPLRHVRIDARDIRRLYERDLVLVRPDGHVAWRGDVAPHDSQAVIDRVRGA